MDFMQWFLTLGSAGVLVFAGVGAVPKGLCSPPLEHGTSWIGNSFPGGEQWVQQDIEGMHVTAEGVVYTNVEWDEAGREVGLYRDGEPVARAGFTHGWGYHGGPAITANEQYLFFSQYVENEGGNLQDPATWPPKGKQWYGVSRRLRSDISRAEPFPGSKGGEGDTLAGSFLAINEVDSDVKAHIAGLAASANRLYISNPFRNEVRVHDASSMEFFTSWAVERPGPMAISDDRTLWILCGSNRTVPAQILHLDSAGRKLHSIQFEPTSRPTGIAVDASDRLFVSDSGPRQQVLVFEPQAGAVTLRRALGQPGGIYRANGKFGDMRFNMPSAVGVDAGGNVYVASKGSSGGGSTVLESYAREGGLNWRLFGLTFVDMADLDPDDPNSCFTKEEHFRLDYGKPPGKEWSYTGYTIDPFRFPEDPRLHIWSAGAWVRRMGDRRYLFVNDMNAQYLQVYRFDRGTHGEIGIPSGLFTRQAIRDKGSWPPAQPEQGEWIWRDRNGDGGFNPGEFEHRDGAKAPPGQGWWVDSLGNVWQATETEGIRQFHFQGTDSLGNPIWDYDSLTLYPHLTEFEKVKRIRYDARQDTMYVGGTTAEDKNQHWKPMGPVMARYDRWSSGERTLAWRTVAPYAEGTRGHSSCEPMTLEIAGQFLFVPYTGASEELGFSTGHVEVFRLEDGTSVGHMEPPPVVGKIGLQDIRESIRVHRRAEGEYIVLLEDDWKAKVLMYRWKPGE